MFLAVILAIFHLSNMKRICRYTFWVSLNCLLLIHESRGQETVKANEAEIINWLQQNTTPIKHTGTQKGYRDLMPLKKVLNNVKVVGLGENTHGTREFFQLKHRLLAFLVTQMDFTVFAIEAGYGSCDPINEYVLYGKGDLATALTAQGYVVWDTQEFSHMLQWMRTYNQSVPENKKVKFYGIDFLYNEPGREKVLTYLQKYDVKKGPATDSLFQVISKEEKQWFRDRDESVLKNALPRLQGLIHYLAANKEKFVAASSVKEFEQILKYTQVMEQRITALNDRSRTMGKNLLYVMGNQPPQAKVVVWAHNTHLSVGDQETGGPNLGFDLRQKFGAGYYTIGFTFNKGSYQSRTQLPDKSFGDLQVMTVSPAPKEYVDWYLSRTKKGNLFWNLRDPVRHPAVKQWLSEPQLFRSFGWLNFAQDTLKANIKPTYDGIIFLENTSPTHPTPNALQSVMKREGL
jgi:erythromycin esterase